MNRVFWVVLSTVITGCAATSWTSSSTKDEFTDETSCKVLYGNTFGREFVKAQGGIHFYPFIERRQGQVIFGVHNDYGVPTGDVQVRVDNNEAVTISYTETPVFYSASSNAVDLSYLKSVEGVDQEAMQTTLDESMKNIGKMSSPFTATSGDKAKKIIEAMKSGSIMKMRVIGFGTNSSATNVGEYTLNQDLLAALAECGL